MYILVEFNWNIFQQWKAAGMKNIDKKNANSNEQNFKNNFKYLTVEEHPQKKQEPTTTTRNCRNILVCKHIICDDGKKT